MPWEKKASSWARISYASLADATLGPRCLSRNHKKKRAPKKKNVVLDADENEAALDGLDGVLEQGGALVDGVFQPRHDQNRPCCVAWKDTQWAAVGAGAFIRRSLESILVMRWVVLLLVICLRRRLLAFFSVASASCARDSCGCSWRCTTMQPSAQPPL